MMTLSREFKDNTMLTEQHGFLRSRLARTYAEINKCESLIHKPGLLKIYKNISNQWAKLDNEMIACRAWHKLTPAYHTLAKEINDNLDYLDKHLMWAKLL
jgi:hypothetical protein